MFRCLKVWVKIGLGICNFAEWIHVHEIYCLPSKKFKEYQESGFLELAFLDRFTGNIDIYLGPGKGPGSSFKHPSTRNIIQQ